LSYDSFDPLKVSYRMDDGFGGNKKDKVEEIQLCPVKSGRQD